MSKKEVIIRSSSILAWSYKESVKWEDLWISYKLKTKKKDYFAPTLIGSEDLKYEIELEIKYLSEHTEEGNETLSKLQNILNILKTEDYFIENNEKYPQIPTLYTSKSLINRKEAENMIKFFMESKGFYSIKCIWKNLNHKCFLI